MDFNEAQARIDRFARSQSQRRRCSRRALLVAVEGYTRALTQVHGPIDEFDRDRAVRLATNNITLFDERVE